MSSTIHQLNVSAFAMGIVCCKSTWPVHLASRQCFRFLSFHQQERFYLIDFCKKTNHNRTSAHCFATVSPSTNQSMSLSPMPRLSTCLRWGQLQSTMLRRPCMRRQCTNKSFIVKNTYSYTVSFLVWCDLIVEHSMLTILDVGLRRAAITSESAL